MKIVVSAPSSHPAVRWVSHGLVGRGHSVDFVTSFAVPADQDVDQPFIVPAIRRELERRRLPGGLVRSNVHNAGVAHDICRVVLERTDRLGLNLAVHNKMILRVQKEAIRRIQRSRPDFVIATGSMNPMLSEYCFANNIPLLVYLPQPAMGLVRKLDPTQVDKMLPEERVKASELFSATHFLASSTFVAESLRDAGLQQPIIRRSLGFPAIRGGERTRRWAGEERSGAFRIVFAGRASEQKGLPYLLDGIQQLNEAGKRVELLAISRDVEKLSQMVRERGLTAHVRVVPPMPRGELFEKFRDQDLFVLPSIFEGYGLVIVEALANGLPVLATPLTAASDLDVHDKCGFVIPAKSSDAIASSISRLIDFPELHRAFSVKAADSTAQLDWESYAKMAAKDVEAAMSEYLQRKEE